MKGINIFCSSQTCGAISLSTMEQPSSSSSSPPSNILPSSSPAIDRYNPIIRDSSRIAKTIANNIPKPHKSHHTKKNKSSKNKPRTSIPVKEIEDQSKKSEISSTLDDDNTETISDVINPDGIIISPPGSTRYLLQETPSSDLFAEEVSIAKNVRRTEELSDPPYQVVVLRVSLHCRGCERKMRKHLSKMEGVTSFNIDFAAKKVTVSGNVTPLGVLSSISKVKNAQLWSPTISSSINFTNSEFHVGDIGLSVS